MYFLYLYFRHKSSFNLFLYEQLLHIFYLKINKKYDVILRNSCLTYRIPLRYPIREFQTVEQYIC